MSNERGALDLGAVDIGSLGVDDQAANVAGRGNNVGKSLSISNPVDPNQIDNFEAVGAFSDSGGGFHGFKTPGFSVSDSKRNLLALSIVLVAAFFLLFEDEVFDVLSDGSIEPEEIVEAEDLPSVDESPQPKKDIVSTDDIVSFQDLMTNQVFTQNPYFFVENNLELGNVNKDMLMLPPTLEHEWREDLQHRYLNTRLNTVREIRKMRMKGSEILLYESLDQPKLWIRMEALLGLAEMGVKFEINTAQRIISNTRVSLQKNFFKRYERKLSLAEQYTFRQLVKVSAGPVRAQILANLVKNRGVESHIFVQAGRFDQDPVVANWFNENIGPRSLLPGSLSAYRKAVQDGYLRQLKEEEKAVKKDLSKDLEEINKDATASYGGVDFKANNSDANADDDIDEQIGVDGEDGFNDLVEDAENNE